MSLAASAGLGLGLGVVTGIPLGVINVAIADATLGGRRRYAIGLGIGGGIADATHAGLAVLGVGQLILVHPELVRGLAIVATATITAYAIVAWRRTRAAPGGDGAAPTSAPPTPALGSLVHGVGAGVVLTLPNPGALAAWVAVAASVWPRASVAEACTAGVCVGLGSSSWFTALGIGLGRVRRDHPALRWVPRIAIALLVAIAIVGLARVL